MNQHIPDRQIPFDLTCELYERGVIAVSREPTDEIIKLLYGPYLSPSSDRVRRKAWEYLVFVLSGGDNG